MLTVSMYIIQSILHTMTYTYLSSVQVIIFFLFNFWSHKLFRGVILKFQTYAFFLVLQLAGEGGLLEGAPEVCWSFSGEHGGSQSELHIRTMLDFKIPSAWLHPVPTRSQCLFAKIPGEFQHEVKVENQRWAFRTILGVLQNHVHFSAWGWNGTRF